MSLVSGMPGNRRVPQDAAHLDLLSLVRQIIRRQRTLQDRVSAAEEEGDCLALDLEELRRRLERAAPIDRSPLPSPRPGRRRRLTASDELRRISEAGASTLEWKRRSDGTVSVRIDGGREFTLPPLLADVLSVLAHDDERGTDGFVRWKSMQEVGSLLEQKMARKLSRHAIAQAVYRLRNALFDRGGVNPFLVQSHRQLGLRFALRRKGSPLADARST